MNLVASKRLTPAMSLAMVRPDQISSKLWQEILTTILRVCMSPPLIQGYRFSCPPSVTGLLRHVYDLFKSSPTWLVVEPVRKLAYNPFSNY